MQGRAEFIEKYREVISELLARGFAVATFDWRGQGGSERLLRTSRAGHVEDFDDFQLDLDAIITAMQARDLPQPWAMLAHSTGACLAMQHIARGGEHFRRAVLTSPLVGIAGRAAADRGRFCPVCSRLLASRHGAFLSGPTSPAPAAPSRAIPSRGTLRVTT